MNSNMSNYADSLNLIFSPKDVDSNNKYRVLYAFAHVSSNGDDSHFLAEVIDVCDSQYNDRKVITQILPDLHKNNAIWSQNLNTLSIVGQFLETMPVSYNAFSTFRCIFKVWEKIQ